MKTSNVLFLSGLLVLLASFLVHDYGLKATYDSKSYLDPYRDCVPMGYKDFHSVHVVSSVITTVKFMQGPYKVLVDKSIEKVVHMTQDGGQLKIEAVYEPDDYVYSSGRYMVYIWCPALNAVFLDNKYRSGDKIIRDSIYADWQVKTMLEGFKLDSLTVKEDDGSYLVLDSNQIGLLKADLGPSNGSASALHIAAGNQIGKASINVYHQSDLYLNAPIPDLEYHLDDSAGIMFSGSVRRTVKAGN